MSGGSVLKPGALVQNTAKGLHGQVTLTLPSDDVVRQLWVRIGTKTISVDVDADGTLSGGWRVLGVDGTIPEGCELVVMSSVDAEQLRRLHVHATASHPRALEATEFVKLNPGNAYWPTNWRDPVALNPEPTP